MLKIINTRHATKHVRRRRECENCGKRYTTYEIEASEYHYEPEPFDCDVLGCYVRRTGKEPS